jgi:4-hydroxythreonine-4-phosphate dehydrogenase
MDPRLALVIGDPAGIGPELMAKLLARPDVRERAALLVIGDGRVLAGGASVAGVEIDCETVLDRAVAVPARHRPVLWDQRDCDPASITPAKATPAGGASAIGNYAKALDLARDGQVDAVTFVPFNKEAIRAALGHYEDEVTYAVERLGFDGTACEFNIIEGLWNARVTSHVPLKQVAELLTRERIVERLHLTLDALRRSGVERPRIGVAALNPHAGDGGAFGSEEIDIIRPAVEAAQAQGIEVEGPFPSDTVFVRARRGEFDAVLTMYHDQGQIAIKLLGFDQGVTLIAGGLPFPITTPAHGTAYDITGRGVANPEPTWRAFDIACRLVERGALARAA